jgi:hypothetical protein
METDVDGATNALRQWKEGIPVEDDWYRHALNDHAKGKHKGFVSPLCPACAEV